MNLFIFNNIEKKDVESDIKKNYENININNMNKMSIK